MTAYPAPAMCTDNRDISRPRREIFRCRAIYITTGVSRRGDVPRWRAQKHASPQDGADIYFQINSAGRRALHSRLSRALFLCLITINLISRRRDVSSHFRIASRHLIGIFIAGAEYIAGAVGGCAARGGRWNRSALALITGRRTPRAAARPALHRHSCATSGRPRRHCGQPRQFWRLRRGRRIPCRPPTARRFLSSLFGGAHVCAD